MTANEGENAGAARALAAALGRIASGLFVVTVRHGSAETGMLASWVQQCSFSPPQVTFAVNSERPVLPWLNAGTPFTVNVLAEGQKQFVAHFGKGFDLDEPAFQGVELLRLDGSAPALRDALAYLDCRVAARVPAGDHVLVMGRVVGGAVLHDGRPTVHVRKNGMHY